MLTLFVQGDESFDEKKEEFVYTDAFELHLEHSLVSLSKWEQEFEKPFLSLENPTDEEMMGYVVAMILEPEPTSEMLRQLTEDHIKKISDYMNRKMSATWFTGSDGGSRGREAITSELIYYWMSAYNIHKSFETEHLNTLFTRIKVHHQKTQPPKKMTPDEVRAQQAEINRKRREEWGTTG